VIQKHWTTILLLVLGTSTIAIGCSDDGNSTTTSSSGSAGGGGSGGGSSSSSSSSSSSGAGGEGGAGGGMNAVPGQSAHALVNSGDVAKSDNYKMVFTLGQSSPLQTNIKSQNYRLKGGLIGSMADAK
jgi:hypothetical protein